MQGLLRSGQQHLHGMYGRSRLLEMLAHERLDVPGMLERVLPGGRDVQKMQAFLQNLQRWLHLLIFHNRQRIQRS